MDRRPTDDLTTESDSSAGPDSPAFPMVDLVSPASIASSSTMEEKTVAEGIAEAKAEMNELSIADKLSYVKTKVSSHATCSTQLSGAIRSELKDYRKEIRDTEATIGILKNNLGTFEHLITISKVNLKGVEDTLLNVQRKFDSTLKKVRERDGHTEFVVRLIETVSCEMESSFAEVCSRNSFLETENARLNAELLEFKKSIHHKRKYSTDSDDDVEFVNEYSVIKKPKAEIDLTVIKPLYGPLSEISKALPEVSITPVPSTSKDSTLAHIELQPKTEVKPKIKLEETVKLDTKAKGWIDDERKFKSEVKDELTERSDELHRLDEEYKKEAAIARKKQKKHQAEIAARKEDAALRKSSEESTTSTSSTRSTTVLVPGTYKIRRFGDQFEIIYRLRNGQTRSDLLNEYGDTGWAEMPLTLLKILVPSVMCVQFKYGPGLIGAGDSLPIHVDTSCGFSHVSAKLLNLEEPLSIISCSPVHIQLTWGPYLSIWSGKYIDLQLSDHAFGKAKLIERFFIIDNAEYPDFDLKRITVGEDFVKKYLKSKRASYECGELMWGDNNGTSWKTSYQRKTGKR